MSDICKEFEDGICYNEGELLIIGSPEAVVTFKDLSDKHDARLLVPMNSRLVMLSKKGWLRSPDQFNKEGGSFYAVKVRSGLRAYGWYTHYKTLKCYIISHFILKKRNKLKKADKVKMQNIKKQWELDHGRTTK